MNGHHSSKTISFLMELIFVLFFFTIASAISVYVVVEAKDKNEEAVHLRNVLYYGKNLIANQDDPKIVNYLRMDNFYLDINGTPTSKKNLYKVSIQRNEIAGLEDKEQCVMQVSDDDILTKLSFMLDKGER